MQYNLANLQKLGAVCEGRLVPAHLDRSDFAHSLLFQTFNPINNQ